MSKRATIFLPARTALLALCLGVQGLSAAAGTAAGAPVAVSMDHPDSWSLAPGVLLGSTLRLAAVPLDDRGPRTLLLERVRVFAPGARIVVHGPQGDTTVPVPDNAYFRGGIEGDPRSAAFLTVGEGGALRGLVTDGGRYWTLASDGPAATVRRIDAETELAADIAAWSCTADELRLAKALDDPRAPALPSLPWRSKTAASAVDKSAAYTARLAIETDREFYQRFGNTADAVAYIGDLIGYASGIYAAEVQTSLEVSSISLWSGESDPWTQEPGRCALYEFGRYWNDNHGGEERTIAHFLSGANNGVGIAWVGVLCGEAFPYDHGGSCPTLTPAIDNYGGAYGFSSGISGIFDPHDPSLVWDILAVAHEIGHNFNSRHSHCYGGVGGNPDPVDECYAGQCGQGGCYCGEQSLPCTSDEGCGTVMSYCHVLPGALGNISFTLGAGHPWGVEPERIPNRMNDHVVAQAAANPGCLDLVSVPGALFGDGFESGNANAWTVAAQ